MFVPIVLDFENNGLKFLLLKYLRFLHHCIENNWLIITHAEFEKYELNFPNRNEYSQKMMKDYEYSLYSKEERASVKQYFISSEYFEKLEKKAGSKLESALYLLNNNDSELEDILDTFVADIYASGEKIEGFLYFAACPLSVKKIAQKNNIPLIAYETGPIRMSNYRCKTSYFCNEGLYTTNEVENRFEKFKKELKTNDSIPIFTRREILALFLSDNNLKYLSLIDKTPEYEIGVAGGCALVVPYFAIDKYMDHELVDDVLDIYKPQDIFFRLHPGDMYKSTYRLHHYDITPNPFVFLLNSKRIAAVGSNLLFEAMLWERIPCCKTSVMPATFMCEKNYKANTVSEDMELFVNFYVFSFLVPYELACNEAYMKWRLSQPSETEIYMQNIMYYMDKFELSEEWLNLKSEERFNMLKLYRNYAPMKKHELKEEMVLAYPQNVEERKNEELEQRYNETKEHLDAVLNSTSWKLTFPIRKIVLFLRGGHHEK